VFFDGGVTIDNVGQAIASFERAIVTGPFMHDGSQKTLLEVVERYAKGGHLNPHLSDQDKQDLVAFMAEGLLSEFPQVEMERLPQ